MLRIPAGSVGVYTNRSRLLQAKTADTLAEVESLGFAAAWIANTHGEFDVLEQGLASTSTLVVGSAVVSVWDVDAQEVARRWEVLDRIASGRIAVGLGVSHASLVERDGRLYTRPLGAMRDYLDGLDGSTPRLRAEIRLLGANGPRMLALAAARTAGALTYVVTPERTAVHRNQLGPDRFLAPELKVVLARDRSEFRSRAREHLVTYLALPNYYRNLLRMGFTVDDLAGTGSDRLVDKLVAGPRLEDMVSRVAEHRDGGADHVALHLVTPDLGVPIAGWRVLAEALGLAQNTDVRG